MSPYQVEALLMDDLSENLYKIVQDNRIKHNKLSMLLKDPKLDVEKVIELYLWVAADMMDALEGMKTTLIEQQERS